jgi:beta-glucanase (GH16 family)
VHHVIILLTTVLFFLAGSLAEGANTLADPGFESSASGSTIRGWQSYGGNAYVQTDSTRAHSGSNYFKVYGAFTANDNWTGIFQDVSSAPGAVYTANGWGFSMSTDAIHGQDQFWLEVTFRDLSSTTLALYRSDIITETNIAGYGGLSTWFNLPVTNQWSFYNSGGVPVGTAIAGAATNLVAPVGTSFVRYQIIFHQGPDNANGSAYLDDCVLNQLAPGTNTPGTAWNIVWSDEFNGTNISTNIWSFENGNNNGWGNGELQYYTSRPQNAYVSNGLLHIVAQKESFAGYSFTSARMKTQNMFSKAYGRFEFRAKLPAGLGFWPALWMLGGNFSNVGWPACGEIDVMENNGNVLNKVQGTIHYSDSNNNHLQSTGATTLTPGAVTNFHKYLLEWQTNSIKWYVDGQLYETQNSWSSSTGPYPAPFNQPFFIIMNLAVGGSYVGNPPASSISTNTTFPGDLQVDYIRVYDLTEPLQLTVERPAGNVLLSWPANIVCHLQAQTNATGLNSNWAAVPGAGNPYTVPLAANSSVFYRLQSP